MYRGGRVGSRHPSGMNVAFFDASVRFILETIDLELLRQLAMPDSLSPPSRPQQPPLSSPPSPVAPPQPPDIPPLTGTERAVADRFIAEYGRNGAILRYLMEIEQGTLLIDVFRHLDYLVSEGANVNARNDDGGTLLHTLAWIDDVAVAEILMIFGADVDAKSNAGDTPLHYAAFAGNIEIAELFVSNEADIGVINNLGDTPLHDAAAEGHIEIVRFLVTSGANVNARNNANQTPLDLARREGHTAVVTFLAGRR